MNQPATRYSGTAIALHWLMALAIVGNFCVGLYMSDLPMSIARLKLYNYHKWTGATILLLAALRLLWRLTHRPPAELPAPKWQHTAASVTHWGLYALFFAVPLVGWAYSSAAGFPIVVFGVLPLPDFVRQEPRPRRDPQALARRPGLGAVRAGRAARGRRRQAHGDRSRRPRAPHDARPRLIQPNSSREQP